ncbi:hypothetical protein [Hanstruepera ponticola]|uniref:hypothetical protein n=1 Tax=Hanstruepera ponticola TaxID=2042995 RepID=UPI000CF1245C|nr:hypothetical protein [Hanstruepera ponticola]
MKYLFITIVVLFCFQVNFAQENIFIDENGNEIKEIDFKKKSMDRSLMLSAWKHIDDKGEIVYTLKKDLYKIDILNYKEVKDQIEILINRRVPDNNTILLEYYYKDDLCTSNRDNIWTRKEVINRKKFTNSLKRKIEKDYITYIVLFEKEIVLKNNHNNKKEYFYADETGFFRDNIFKNPTICGSFALIKSNGETVIRNGEYRADLMAKHLKPENWNLFFKPQD